MVAMRRPSSPRRTLAPEVQAPRQTATGDADGLMVGGGPLRFELPSVNSLWARCEFDAVDHLLSTGPGIEVGPFLTICTELIRFAQE